MPDSGLEVSLHPEGPATGQLDHGFPLFPFHLEQMLGSWVPKTHNQVQFPDAFIVTCLQHSIASRTSSAFCSVSPCHWTPPPPPAHTLSLYTSRPEDDDTVMVQVLLNGHLKIKIEVIILWHVDPLLGNDRKINNYTAVVVK
jgi:hypothetical protein